MSLKDGKDMHSRELMEFFRSACRQAGMKVTRQRLHIYLELLKSGDHPTAETLFSRLRPPMPQLSLDTVYRALSTFEQTGLIRRVNTVKSQARYEAQMNPHHHFVCNTCGTVIDFDWPVFDQETLPETVLKLGTVSLRTVTVSGICCKCSGKKG